MFPVKLEITKITGYTKEMNEHINNEYVIPYFKRFFDGKTFDDETDFEIYLERIRNVQVNKLCDITGSGRHQYIVWNAALKTSNATESVKAYVYLDTQKTNIGSACCKCRNYKHTPENPCFGKVCCYEKRGNQYVSVKNHPNEYTDRLSILRC